MVLTGVGVVLVAILVFLAFDGPQKFFTLFAAGVALGAVYALVCLGFVVIYRATGIVNFAQVGMVVFGAFVTYNAVYTWGWSFWLSMLFSAGVLAVIGIGFERFALRRMTGKPIFSIILLTIGLYLLLQSLIGAIWTNAKDTIPNPWIGKTISLGSVKILQVDFVTMILGAVVLAGFFGLFRYTKVGLGMRATAIDQEAALAQGISVPGIVALSWARWRSSPGPCSAPAPPRRSGSAWGSARWRCRRCRRWSSAGSTHPSVRWWVGSSSASRTRWPWGTRPSTSRPSAPVVSPTCSRTCSWCWSS
jgi:hypothetical protein